MISQYGSFTSYQVNVDADGHNIVGDAANEPSIAVDPNNPGRMAIGWRQFSDVTSDFREAGWAYTTDGGLTWTFPRVLETNAFRSDPVLNSDENGNFFYGSLQLGFCVDMWGSLDGGQSWTGPGAANGGDKEWIAIDKTKGIGHGFQYETWDSLGNCQLSGSFTRSTDGGQPGCFQLISLTWPHLERSTWIRTAMFLSAVSTPALATRFGAFARATHRMEM
jgi:hypothetical protein